MFWAGACGHNRAGEVLQGLGAAIKCGLTFKKLKNAVGIQEEIVMLTVTKSSGKDATAGGCWGYAPREIGLLQLVSVVKHRLDLEGLGCKTLKVALHGYGFVDFLADTNTWMTMLSTAAFLKWHAKHLITVL